MAKAVDIQALLAAVALHIVAEIPGMVRSRHRLGEPPHSFSEVQTSYGFPTPPASAAEPSTRGPNVAVRSWTATADCGTVGKSVARNAFAEAPEAPRQYGNAICFLANYAAAKKPAKLYAREEEPGDWVEGKGSAQSLRPVRDALMTGDLRPFYVGWLRAAIEGSADDDVEPPVPPGLAKLPMGLNAFTGFR